MEGKTGGKGGKGTGREGGRSNPCNQPTKTKRKPLPRAAEVPSQKKTTAGYKKDRYDDDAHVVRQNEYAQKHTARELKAEKECVTYREIWA